MSKGGSHDPQVVADGRSRSPPRSALGLPRPAVFPAADSGAVSMAGSGTVFTVGMGAAFTAGSSAAFIADLGAAFRRIRCFLSELLPIWLFPVLLLLLLIAYGLRPETAQPDRA